MNVLPRKNVCLPGKIISVARSFLLHGNMALMTFTRSSVVAMTTVAILKSFLVEAANIADDPTAITQLLKCGLWKAKQ